MGGDERALVLFDGVCHLCSRSVRFIIRRDRKGRFRFAPLQSETARRLIGETGKGPVELTDPPASIILLENGRIYTESDAVLRIARRLDGPWKLAAALGFVPKRLRDAFYRWIAANRYRWFGRSGSCMIPSPEIRERFVSDDG